MQVRCRDNRVQALASDTPLVAYLAASVRLDGGRLPLRIGTDYPVHALLLTNLGLWFFVCEDRADSYPKAYPAGLFEVLDPCLPPGWQVGTEAQAFSGGGRQAYGLVTFPEWAGDAAFYEALVDGDAEAERVFARCRQPSEGRQDAARR